MKLLSIVTHPVIVIISFLVIMISGQQFGGFYLIYVLLALPHGGLHALLAAGGIVILLVNLVKFKRAGQFMIEPILHVLGTGCLYFSLYIFFIRSKSYNSATFEQSVPFFTLALFAVLSVGSLLYSIMRYTRVKPDKKGFAV